MQANAAWFLLKKTKCRLPGSLSPLREENQPCSCPSPLSPSPLPTASSLDSGWSKTIVADRQMPQQIPAAKHLGKCFFFPKKSASGLAYDSQPPGFTSQTLPRTVKGPSTHWNWAVTGAGVFVGWCFEAPLATAHPGNYPPPPTSVGAVGLQECFQAALKTKNKCAKR